MTAIANTATNISRRIADIMYDAQHPTDFYAEHTNVLGSHSTLGRSLCQAR